MHNIDEAEIDKAIEATYYNPEFEKLADFFDGHDDPFYTGLRYAFAYQQMKIDKLKDKEAKE